MSLRNKIGLILLGVIVSYAAIDNGIVRLTWPSFFKTWEENDAERSLNVVRAMIDSSLEDLSGKAKIWASAEETYRFATRPTDRYAGYLDLIALRSTDVDVFYIVDVEGFVQWGEVVDPSTREPMSIREALPKEALSESHPLRNFRADQDFKVGIMMTDRAPVLVCSYPIQGPKGIPFAPDRNTRFRSLLHGTVILGTFLDDERRAGLAPEGTSIKIYDRQKVEVTPSQAVLFDELTAGEAWVSEVGADDQLHLYENYQDERTGTPLILEVAVDREITRRGRRWVNYALISTIGSALFLLIVLLRLLQRIVVRPLSRLTSKAVEIGKTDDTSIRVGMDRGDEIGQLSDEFDSMLGKLAESRRQVVQTARLAGMSQIATGVLHNVGNALNSVNVSATVVSKRTEKLPVKDLEMMADVLREHEDDIATFVTENPKGKHLLPFLFEVTGSLSSMRESLMEEIRSLNGGLDHIADLVRAQQTFAGTKGVFELASLEDEVEAAVRFCQNAMVDHAGFDIDRDFEELPQLLVDKHKLLEILVNLIQNAVEAMDEVDQGERRLTLRILRADEGTARIEVQDSGTGITEEDLTRVFHHGFTTKSDGHGFGLHVSANAATEMNASLQAKSDGPGKGATFYLDIPIKTNELAQAA